MDKVCLENILFVNKCINGLLPPIFLMIGLLLFQLNILTKYRVQLKKNFLNPQADYDKNYVIASFIQSWNNTQQKLGSLKTLPSAKIKQLITDEVLKNY